MCSSFAPGYPTQWATAHGVGIAVVFQTFKGVYAKYDTLDGCVTTLSSPRDLCAPAPDCTDLSRNDEARLDCAFDCLRVIG